MSNQDQSKPLRLFAVMLGGRAPGCNVELHDVVFAVGHALEDLHPQLLDAWFGSAKGLHVDAWTALDQVEGYSVELKSEPGPAEVRLYFINIGGYRSGEFAEQHAYAFIAAANKAEAKRKAKARLLIDHEQVHKDDLYEVDDCLPVDRVGAWHVYLRPEAHARVPKVTNGYFPLPAATIRAWQASRGKRS